MNYKIFSLKSENNTNLVTGQRHNEILEQLAHSGSFIPRIKQDIDKNQDKIIHYANAEVKCLIDYLNRYISTGDDTYKNLYVGERLKMAYAPDITAKERNNRLVTFMQKDKAAFLDSLKGASDSIIQVEQFFNGIIEEFSVDIEAELNVLFVGDCIHQDVMGTLSTLVAKYGISLSPRKISAKSAYQISEELKAFENQKIDAIFFSPFSYEFLQEFSSLFHYKNFFMGGFSLAEQLMDVMTTVESIIDIISVSFDCPIFIHNTVVPIRDESSYKIRIKKLLVDRLRRLSIQYIDKRLSHFITKRNDEKFKQLFLIDELKLLENTHYDDLCRYIYRSPLQHPTRLGVLLAEEYMVRLRLIATFFKKKIIVCDLDNTLWNGVIGEGDVSHYYDRQKILQGLMKKGVLLAINSKNDPKNVNWDGGVLNESDFVFSAISWEPKINAFPRIVETLNIKISSFVFIDDRADELAMVKNAYPEVECLDATQEKSWQLLQVWETHIESSGIDRTKIYKERAKRGEFVNSIKPSLGDESEAFKKLELVLSLEQISRKDIKRVVELVNRTNQFNMRGSRTSFAEVEGWFHDDKTTILQAKMSDKFGEMGTVGVIVYTLNNDNSISIPVYVLSCRVFGYQVEFAILNRLKRDALELGANSLIGEYIDTGNNSPCSQVYKKADFIEQDGGWVYDVKPNNLSPDPEWLCIKLSS